VDFKSRIPPRSSCFGVNTIGLFHQNRFMIQGRHEVYAEIWTSPSDIGDGFASGGKEKVNWKNDMVCLAVSTQMALVVPMKINSKRADAKTKL